MPPSTIILRRATKADLPRMVRILLDAFSPGPWGRRLFPPHLKVKPGDGDEYAWRLYMISSVFDNQGCENVLACEGGQGQRDEDIVGWAQWVDSNADPNGGMSLEEKKTKMERELGANPAGLDTEAFETLSREGLRLETRGDEYLGTERSKNSWLLSYLLVDPKHHRKGIGRLLAKEGLDRAAAQGRDVRLRATPEGRTLYLALGFKEVCEEKIFGESQYAMVWKAPGLVRGD
ncbi:hypothetical protein N8I77_009370 [Diaporthe amygdali]|uniref:N-acetyltransferase domain-containing protein n=1 Tax=Phomopsis amygdali TaxID=1214568 RepID=A0AAD9W0M2_PHOAM|nr:hypothetical protein N8I77_009370 [Diaporthe amygdali]